jgi:hypothetical protein
LSATPGGFSHNDASDTQLATDSITAICTALSLAPTTTQVAALQAYLALLQRWNATYNLTAVRDPAGHGHPAPGRLPGRAGAACGTAAQQGRVLLDVGSGGGLARRGVGHHAAGAGRQLVSTPSARRPPSCAPGGGAI